MRKRCTRQHFIEYLSYNYVEKQALIARCIWFRYHPDYGYDGFVHTFNQRGEIEDGIIEFQVKSTDDIKWSKSRNCFMVDLSKRDLETWLRKDKLLILVLYDAKKDMAFFIEISEYFKKNRQSLQEINKFVRIYIPEGNILDADAFRKIKEL